MEGEINVMTRAQAKKGRKPLSDEMQEDQSQIDTNSRQQQGCVNAQNLDFNHPGCSTSTEQQLYQRHGSVDQSIDGHGGNDRYLTRESRSWTFGERLPEVSIQSGPDQMDIEQTRYQRAPQNRDALNVVVEELRSLRMRQQHAEERQANMAQMIETVLERVKQNPTQASGAETRDSVRQGREKRYNASQEKETQYRKSHRSEERSATRYTPESSDSDNSSYKSRSPSPAARRHDIRSTGRDNNPKLPPFTGKESWQIWFNRFNDVANRLQWSYEEKLDKLLPRLQGSAGEFVYGQLSPKIRSNYKILCEELNCRFRVIETSKTFAAKFSRRDQKLKETAESYAAELKRLYNKAYPTRDPATRSEDLLRRFLNGLEDEKASFHVEYIKEPSNIDVAVFEVVNFQETRQGVHRRGHHRVRHEKDYQTRAVTIDSYSSEETDDEITYHIARAIPGENKHRLIKKSETAETEVKEQAAAANQQKSGDDDTSTKETILTEVKEYIKAELDKIEKTVSTNNAENTQRWHGYARNRNYEEGTRFMPKQDRSYQRRDTQSGCFQCGSIEHFRRDCPQLNQRKMYNRGYGDARQTPSTLMDHQEQLQIRREEVPLN